MRVGQRGKANLIVEPCTSASLNKLPRELDADARATFGTVRREHAPLVRFGDFLDEREPEAHGLFAVFAVGGPLVKSLEHPALLARLTAIVGAKYAITDRDAQAPYLVEMRDMFHGHTPVVLRPGTVAEVALILALANETATAVVPQQTEMTAAAKALNLCGSSVAA